MVQIQVMGPSGSRKGYIMVKIAKHLKELGCNVSLQGEETHLAQKLVLEPKAFTERLEGVNVAITEFKT